MARPNGSSTIVAQLKITLLGIRPPVWRRVQVPAAITLPRLHRIIQAVMGWQDYHLHAYRIEGVEYGEPDPDEMYDDDVTDERRVRLDRVLHATVQRFRYDYDFGDGWEHEIVVEKTLPAERGTPYPRLIAGRRACPPEDVGGPWGYREFLKAIADPSHDQHNEMLEWAGGTFDPEEFDLQGVNDWLPHVR